MLQFLRIHGIRGLENPDFVENIAEFVEKRTEPDDVDNVAVVNETGVEEPNETIDGKDGSEDESNGSESNDDELELEKFVDAIEGFKNKVKLSYCKDLKKGVKNLTKHLVKITKGNFNTLKQAMFNIGKDVTNSKSAGKKKKKGKLIPIQVTAKSRRQFKHRGRTVGLLGRRPKDQEKSRQMLVSYESDNVYHTLPKQKKSKNKAIHSLKHSVENNKPAAKKH